MIHDQDKLRLVVLNACEGARQSPADPFGGVAQSLVAQGIPAVIYGAGPRTVRESNAKRADEHLVLDDLRRATKVVARTLLEMLG